MAIEIGQGWPFNSSVLLLKCLRFSAHFPLHGSLPQIILLMAPRNKVSSSDNEYEVGTYATVSSSFLLTSPYGRVEYIMQARVVKARRTKRKEWVRSYNSLQLIKFC
jgi:hypothetical protein